MTSPERYLVLVMGPSGSGKSTVGAALARELDAMFLDADDFCPPPAVEKMRRGQPLDDADREPWLRRLNAELHARATASVVLACSAHRQRYRDWIFAGLPTPHVIYLIGAEALIRARLEARRGHFMPPSLLANQLAIMERPTVCCAPDIRLPPEDVVKIAAAYVCDRKPRDANR